MGDTWDRRIQKVRRRSHSRWAAVGWPLLPQEGQAEALGVRRAGD